MKVKLRGKEGGDNPCTFSFHRWFLLPLAVAHTRTRLLLILHVGYVPREIQLLIAIDHPAIVRVVDIMHSALYFEVRIGEPCPYDDVMLLNASNFNLSIHF